MFGEKILIVVEGVIIVLGKGYEVRERRQVDGVGGVGSESDQMNIVLILSYVIIDEMSWNDE